MPDTILVVEDDPANAVLIEAILGGLGGFDVLCSDNGDRIVQAIEDGGIAAVLMDVSLKNTRVGGV